MNKEQLRLWKEFWMKRGHIQDEMIWVGCNPSNPEMFEKQAEEGFKLMHKLGILAKEYLEKIEKAKCLNKEKDL